MRVARKPHPFLVAVGLISGALGGLPSARAAEHATQAHWVRDSAITVAITARLAAERFSTMTRLRVQTERGGVVSLSGTTGSRREAARAVSIARRIDGVLRVDDHIVIGPPTP